MNDVKPRITINKISVHREELDITPAVNEVSYSTSLFAIKIRRNDTTSPEHLKQVMQLDYNEFVMPIQFGAPNE